MLKKSFLLFLGAVIFIQVVGFSQFNGNYSFDFLDAGFNARVAASGGSNVSFRDDDVNFFQYNPALLNAKMHKTASINFVPYFADVKATSVAYADQIKGFGSVGASLNYISYGKFKGFDESGNQTADFTSNSTVFALSHARQSGNFSFGVNLKFAGSSIANYGSFGTFIDLGGAFVHPKQELVIGLAIRNVGFILKNYTFGSESTMPLNAVLGISFKPKHAPIRISVTASQLNNPTFGEQKLPVAQAILRHFSLGSELLLGKGFHIRAGYNFQQRGELSTETKVGAAGLYLGAMIKVKMIQVAYTWGAYSVKGGTHFLTLNVDINQFLNKKQILPTYNEPTDTN